MEAKPGVKTSEFWLAFLPTALLIIKQILGVELEQDIIANGILGAVAAVTSGVYIYGRVKIKIEETKKKK